MTRQTEWAQLHPFQRTFLPNPDVPNQKNDEKYQNFHKSENTEGFELDRPGKQEDGFHIEDHEQDRDDVVADGVTAAGIVDGIDAALVGHQLGLARIVRADEFSQQQRERKKDCDHCYENEDGHVILRHSAPCASYSPGNCRARNITADGGRLQGEMSKAQNSALKTDEFFVAHGKIPVV